MCERTLIPIHPLPRGWTLPLPHKQRSRAAEKFPMAAVLMWATSKFLMDGSMIAEERARDCHESRVTGRERRGPLVGCHMMLPEGAQGFLQGSPFSCDPTSLPISPFYNNFSMISISQTPNFYVLKPGNTEVKKTKQTNQQMRGHLY